MSTVSNSNNAGTADGTHVERELLEVRKEFALTFKVVTFVILGMVVLALGAMLVALLVLEKQPAAMGLTAALIQIGLAMILGFGCVFFGVVITWLGITSAFSSNLEANGTKVGLQSAGPGLALLIGGMLLIAAALYRDAKYGENPSYGSGPHVTSQPGTSTSGTAPAM